MDFGFPAMLALLLLSGERDFLLQTLLVCVVHECGHGIAMCLTGAGLREVRFCGAGVQMRTGTAVLSRGRLLCIYLSGPAVNLLCAALLRTLSPETAALHLCMGVCNLLPFRVLDGGAALRVFTDGRWLCIGCTALAILLTAGLMLAKITNPFLYLLAVYLAAAEWLT